MKELKFVCAQPDDNYYTWQVHLWLESLREIGHSDKAVVLVFTPGDRKSNEERWGGVMDLYPEVEFKFYRDDKMEVTRYLGLYIPILRPFLLKSYFYENPDMKDKAVFYCDCDVLFTKAFNVDKYIEDDVCYLSDTNSYINASYFDSMIHRTLPEKREAYKERDILQEATNIVGVDRKKAEENNLHSGGAQYFLKNIDGDFWAKMLTDCLNIRRFLMGVNRMYYKDENAGYQSWCADMWSLLWNLWYRGYETKVVPEMNFAWSPDPISKLDTHPIFHNAGITGEKMGDYKCFYKGKYIGGNNPMKDPYLDEILNDDNSKKHCTWYYASKLDELRKKYPNLYG